MRIRLKGVVILTQGNTPLTNCFGAWVGEKACTLGGPSGVVLRTLCLGLSKRTPIWESTIPPGDPPRGPREGTQARIPRSIPKPRVPTPLGGLRVVCVRPYLTECGEPARDKNGLAGRRRIKAQTPSRPTDPHSVTECTLNGTLTCEGPFNGAECYRNGGNPWEKGLGGGRRFLGSPTLP